MTFPFQALAKCTFSIATKDSGFLVQTANEKELNEWLYAINPLLAGQIRCVDLSLSFV